MHNTKRRNVHGRVGVRRSVRPMSGGEIHKRVRRAMSNPHHIERKPTTSPRGWLGPRRQSAFSTLKPVEQIIGESGPEPFIAAKGSGKTARAEEYADQVERSGGSLATISPDGVHLNTKAAAERIGMSVGYVKDHAEALGGEKHGLRWRFEQTKLDRIWSERKS